MTDQNGRHFPFGTHPLEEDPEDSFPTSESFPDCCGNERVFNLILHENALGYSVRAVEIADTEETYEFSAFSTTDEYRALGELRGKIRRALSRKYTYRQNGQIEMLHEIMCGRITSDPDNGGTLVLVVDGQALDLEEFARLVLTYEGFQFKIEIKDPSEEVG